MRQKIFGLILLAIILANNLPTLIKVLNEVGGGGAGFPIRPLG